MRVGGCQEVGELRSWLENRKAYCVSAVSCFCCLRPAAQTKRQLSHSVMLEEEYQNGSVIHAMELLCVHCVQAC